MKWQKHMKKWFFDWNGLFLQGRYKINKLAVRKNDNTRIQENVGIHD